MPNSTEATAGARSGGAVNSGSTFYILDHPLLPTPYNHRFFVEKFARGFAHHGYDVQVITRVDEVRSPGFVMISNHDAFHGARFGGRLGRFAAPVARVARSAGRSGLSPVERAKRGIVTRVAHRARAQRAVVIAWFWQDAAQFFAEIDAPVIFTGEYFYARPASEAHEEWRQFYLQRDDALAIRFSADADPTRIGEGQRDETYDIAYVGARQYKPEWYGEFSAGTRNRIVPTPPYIPEDERIAIYAHAKIALGLHSDANIANAVVVERIFEALAYGAVAISDSPFAPVATDGAALVARDADDLRTQVADLLADDAKRAEVRSRGYDFVRREGTYAHRAGEFIELSRRLYAGG